MIIIKIKAGLGNQLFQYACGRALALRNKDTLKFDLSDWYDRKETDRPYLLSHFRVIGDIATVDEITPLEYPLGRISRILQKIRTKMGMMNIGFNPSILKKSGDIYLDGYWQSEKYFVDQSEKIRDELILKDRYCPEAQEYSDKIKKESLSVALHVRRGDVAMMAEGNPYFGICTQRYYENAVSYISNKIIKPHFFVFSDDIKWVKKNIAIGYQTSYVSSERYIDGIKNYEELSLMSECRHNIVANSSFSWWGAWLNKNINKIVISPKEWITRNKRIHQDTVPSSWIRI